jgi:hypothetical protein
VRTRGARKLDETHRSARSVRKPSAVGSSAANTGQRRQRLDQQVRNAANGANRNKRRSGLVRIEWVVKSEGVSKGTKVAGVVFVIQRELPYDADPAL